MKLFKYKLQPHYKLTITKITVSFLALAAFYYYAILCAMILISAFFYSNTPVSETQINQSFLLTALMAVHLIIGYLLDCTYRKYKP